MPLTKGEIMHLNKIVAKRLSILLYSLSIMLWSYSIFTAELKIGSYGLIDSVNPIFFVATLFLTISFLLILKYYPKSKILALQIFTFYVILYLLPILLEGTPRFTYSYLTYGYTDYIVRHGHVNTKLLPYQNWPGIMYLGSVLSIVPKLDGIQILALYPIIIKLLSLIFVYWILSALSTDYETPWIGTLIYLLGDWIGQGLYVPASLAGVFNSLSLALILLILFKRKRYSYQWAIILVILFFSLVISHLLTSIIMLVSLFVLFILTKIYNLTPKLNTLVMIFSTILLVWLIYPVGDFFSHNLSGFVARMLDIWSIISETERTTVGMGSEHTKVMYIKMLYTVSFSALAALGILHSICNHKLRKSFSTIVPLVIITSYSVIVPLIVGPYSGEIISRAFGYTTPLLAFFIARNWNTKFFAISIILFLIIAPPLFVISAYGNEKLDYVSPSEIAGVNYYYEMSKPKEPIYSLSERIWRFKYIEETRWKQLNIKLLNGHELFVQKGYVAYYDRDIEGYIFLKGKIDYEKIKNTLNNNLNKIYSSGSFDLFYGGE